MDCGLVLDAYLEMFKRKIFKSFLFPNKLNFWQPATKPLIHLKQARLLFPHNAKCCLIHSIKCLEKARILNRFLKVKFV